jgi:hypothetical protein
MRKVARRSAESGKGDERIMTEEMKKADDEEKSAVESRGEEGNRGMEGGRLGEFRKNEEQLNVDVVRTKFEQRKV